MFASALVHFTEASSDDGYGCGGRVALRTVDRSLVTCELCRKWCEVNLDLQPTDFPSVYPPPVHKEWYRTAADYSVDRKTIACGLELSGFDSRRTQDDALVTCLECLESMKDVERRRRDCYDFNAPIQVKNWQDHTGHPNDNTGTHYCTGVVGRISLACGIHDPGGRSRTAYKTNVTCERCQDAIRLVDATVREMLGPEGVEKYLSSSWLSVQTR